MVKDFKYIFKRIIIGVGIALALMFIKSNVFALTSSYSFGSQSLTFDTAYNGFRFDTSGSPWSGAGEGDLTFSFAVVKTSGGATDSNSILRSVHVNVSNGAMFACNVGTTTMTNSTFNNGLYSVSCPVSFPAGVYLSNVVLAFEGNGNLQPSYYSLRWNGLVTFSSKPTTSVSVDTSGTTTAVNNQTQSINNNQNNNTQSIINNQNNNTQSIINNQNNNNQALINNQNSNTDKEIESQKSCTFYDSSSISINNRYLNSDGSLGSNNNYGVSDYISLVSSEVTVTKGWNNTSRYYCFYDSNKTLISCGSGITVGVLTLPTDATFMRFTIYKSSNVPQLKICTNGNQAIVNSQQQINNSITDTSGGEVESSFFDDFATDSSSPVSDLLTMPITLLQAYVNGFSGNCQAMNLGSLYGTYIIIPCINIADYLGTELWNLIDILFTIFMVYNIGMLCITIYEGITSLNDDLQFLYSPRHAGPGDTRVERNSDLY